MEARELKIKLKVNPHRYF